MSLKKYLHIILEGGNAIKSAVRIPADKMDEVKSASERILKEIGISKKDYSFVGSGAGRNYKPTSGDLDVMIDAKPNDKKNETLSSIRDKLKEKGYDFDYQPGFSQVSVGVPFGGGQIAQVDFMVGVEKFGTEALSNDPSKYKGKYKAILVGQLIKDLGWDVKEEYEGQPAVWSQYLLDSKRGIYHVTKSRWMKDKTKLKKTPDTIKKEFLSDNYGVLVSSIKEKYGVPITKKQLRSVEGIIQYINMLKPEDKNRIKKMVVKFYDNYKFSGDEEKQIVNDILEELK